MRITILYDNTTDRPDLVADWGFSALVEARGRRLLFDTGARGGILLGNMARLGVDPRSLDAVFVSHGHFDHIGGLSAVLERNPEVVLYAPVSFRGVRGIRDVVFSEGPRELEPGVFTTGELAGLEQSLAVQSEAGLLALVGCGHPGLGAIVAALREFGQVRAVVGGFHGFADLDLFDTMELVVPAHCTQRREEILRRFPWARPGGVGAVVEWSPQGGRGT